MPNCEDGEWGKEEGEREGLMAGGRKKEIQTDTEKHKTQHRVHRTCLINTDIYPAATVTWVEIIAVHCIVVNENGRNKWNCQSCKPSHLHYK